QTVDLVLLLVRASHTLSGGGNDLTQNVFVANELQVVLHVGRGRNEGEQIRDERRAADAVEQIPVAQHLCERDQVNRLPCVPKIDDDVVDGPVRGDVEVFLVNFLDTFRDGLARRNQH